MKIDFHRNYLKAYKKLRKSIQLQAEELIKLFIQDRKDPLLKDHPLHGRMKDKRAFSVTGDYRIVYEKLENDEVVFLFLDIGKHGSDVYE